MKENNQPENESRWSHPFKEASCAISGEEAAANFDEAIRQLQLERAKQKEKEEEKKS